MLKKLNEAMDYIEEHLDEDFSLEKIAEHVHVSDLHFRKIFFLFSYMSLGEYVKNRKLSKANQELLQGKSVTEIAFRYGYQSVDGFSRAFKKWSGMLPSEAAKLQQCKFFQKLSFVVTIKGGDIMEYKIIEKEAFRFAGVSKRVPMQFEGVNLEIVKLAQSITEQQRNEMHRIQNTTPHEIVNVSYESDTNFLEEKGELTHMIGLLTTREDVSDCLVSSVMLVLIKACCRASIEMLFFSQNCLIFRMATILGTVLPVSHLLTVEKDTESASANSTCDNRAF